MNQRCRQGDQEGLSLSLSLSLVLVLTLFYCAREVFGYEERENLHTKRYLPALVGLPKMVPEARQT